MVFPTVIKVKPIIVAWLRNCFGFIRLLLGLIYCAQTPTKAVLKYIQVYSDVSIPF